VIVRILGEGQFQVDDTATAELNRLDTDLETAVEHSDQAGWACWGGWTGSACCDGVYCGAYGPWACCCWACCCCWGCCGAWYP